MKAIKWIVTALALAILIAVAVTGTLGDERPNGESLYIVQSELQRSADGLTEVNNDRELLPGVYEELTQTETLLADTFSVTDKKNHTVDVDFSVNADMYTAENALDHIVVVTNTGTVDGYIRAWFAFEMGDLTKEEFEASVLLNQNTTAWDWDNFEYGVMIGGDRYAVVCAKHKDALAAKQTTAPSLLQIMLKSSVTNEMAQRLDGNNDGRYEIKVFSRAVSDKDAWGAITHPWK